MNTKIIAIVAVVILAGGIAGVVILNNTNNDDSDSSITIVDGSGRTIKLDKPLKDVAVTSSNITKSMKMLGISDNIKCYQYSGSYGIKAESDPDAKLGTYYSPSVETMLAYNVDAVLCPKSSMTLLAGTAKTCEENGIPVIRLDCYGDSLTEDVNKLSKLFGEPESATKALDRYTKEYNDMLSAIEKALGDKKKVNYMYAYGLSDGAASISNEHSGLSEILSAYFEKNITEYTNLGSSTTSVSNPVNDNTREELQKVQDKVDCLAMRVNLDKGTSDAVSLFPKLIGDGKIVTASSPAYKNSQIYTVNTNLVSGLYGHFGILLLVTHVYGIEVEGYTDINKLISDFQAWTTLDQIEDKEVILIHFDNDGTPHNLAYAEP